jgi:tRNA dimethylallyltransferase
MKNVQNPPIRVFCGPTASGKSALALNFAVRHRGVIINADSQQLYQDLPVLTAQPHEEDKQKALHILYGFLPADQIMGAGAWAQNAAQHIKKSFESGLQPVLCGGTGFYLKSLWEGLSPIPDIPTAMRDQGNHLYDEMGPDQFYKLILDKDPILTKKLNPNDRQRMVRAYEVFEYTGRTLSSWHQEPLVPFLPDCFFDVDILLPERSVLQLRIRSRLQAMIAGGVLDEIADFLKKIPRPDNGDWPAWGLIKSCGFLDFVDYLQGRTTLDEAFEKAIIDTNQYAKRQETWFRNQIKQEKNIAQLKIIH